MDLADSKANRQASFRLSVSRFGGRLWRGGVVVAAIVMASTGIAVASNAIKGASYTGSYAGAKAGTISFKVSANGKQVIGLSASTPFKCEVGCGGVPNPTIGSAAISKKGKFEAKLTLIGLGSSKKSIGNVTVTGTFLKHGEATGTVTSHFNAGGGGATVSWSAVGLARTG